MAVVGEGHSRPSADVGMMSEVYTGMSLGLSWARGWEEGTRRQPLSACRWCAIATLPLAKSNSGIACPVCVLPCCPAALPGVGDSFPEDVECPPPPPGSTARATARLRDSRPPGVVKQDKSSGGSVDTTKTRSGPQRVRMSSGERPIGTAKGTQSDTEALCQPPPPPPHPPPPSKVRSLGTTESGVHQRRAGSGHHRGNGPQW